MNTNEITEYLEARGFEIIGTGGNCEAYRATFGESDQYEILIADECSLPTDSSEMTCLLLDPNGDEIDMCDGDLCGVVAWSEKRVVEILAQIEAGA